MLVNNAIRRNDQICRLFWKLRAIEISARTIRESSE
jgi:hypothetical protein